MRLMYLCSLWLVCSYLTAAELLSVPSADQVIVEVYGVPVSVHLAQVNLPENEELRQQAVAYLRDAAVGKTVRLKYESDYGEIEGTGRVHVLKSSKSLNVELVQEGLLAYDGTGADRYAKKMKEAEKQAKAAKKGLWSKKYSSAKPNLIPVAAVKEEGHKSRQKNVANTASTDAKVKAAFCAELRGKYFYPSNSPEAKKLNPKKIVYYKTEKDAMQAGKKKPKAKKEIKVEQSVDGADELMEKGEKYYYAAVGKPVSQERNKNYSEAYNYFTKAMLMYRDFYEKDQDNEALGEKLRRCNQLRYGAMKYRVP